MFSISLNFTTQGTQIPFGEPTGENVTNINIYSSVCQSKTLSGITGKWEATQWRVCFLLASLSIYFFCSTSCKQWYWWCWGQHLLERLCFTKPLALDWSCTQAFHAVMLFSLDTLCDKLWPEINSVFSGMSFFGLQNGLSESQGLLQWEGERIFPPF